MFFPICGVQKLRRRHPKLPKKDKSISCQSWKTYTDMASFKVSKRNLKNQYHWDFKRRFLTLQDAGKGRDVFFGGMIGGRNTSCVAEK